MVKWLFISSACWAGLGGVWTLWAFLKFDRLIKHLYVTNHSEWLNFGMPTGFFWVPEELKGLNGKSLFGSGMARSALFQSVSKSATCPFQDASGTEYGDFRVATMLRRISFVAAAVCFGLTVVCIFL